MPTLFRLVPFLLVAVSLLLAQEQTTMAIQPLPPIPVSVNPPNYSFGMVGLTAGQILRVVVTNVGTAPPIASPIAIPACGVSVKLFDQDGKAVGASGQIGSLAAGKSFAVEQAGPTGSGRLEYRAQVQVVFPIVSAGTPVRLMVCSIISTVQVYDTVTGKTDVVLAGNPLIMGFFTGPLGFTTQQLGISGIPEN